MHRDHAMPSRKKNAAVQASRKAEKRSLEEEVQSALKWLKSHGSRRTLEGMVRYGIHVDKAFGVSMANIQVLGKRLGRNHELAIALWDSGWYEARLLTSFVDEPERVTPAQMDRWCRQFDNWSICDTVCFFLFDRTPHAWDKVKQWSDQNDEFVKRAAFALMACLALHDKTAADRDFLAFLPLIEKGSRDERNFVKKSVVWALNAIGRRNWSVHTAAVTVSRRLMDSLQPAAQWVGKSALRELMKPAVVRLLATRSQTAVAHTKKKHARTKEQGRPPMSNSGKLQITTSSEREIVITRLLNAPRHLAFAAWTKPELVKRWMLGPPGWSFVVCDIDLRVGGSYRFVWRNRDGIEMGMSGVYREILPPERLISTQKIDQDATDGETLTTLVLTEQGGKTTATITALYPSLETRDAALNTNMAEGMEAGYVRLEEVLASLPGQESGTKGGNHE